ncbi:MAG: class I SAM-dependent methyltransferase [Patescibacteria group bacterium]
MWRNYLASKEKCIFFSYIHLQGQGQENVFYYVNDGSEEEQVVALCLTQAGELPAGVTPWQTTLAPGAALKFDAKAHLATAGIQTFVGGLLLVISNPKNYLPLFIANKDLVSTWSGSRASAQIGIAGAAEWNSAAKKAQKSYYMFCPAVLENDSTKTLITIFNSSTDAGYADAVIMEPRLHNLRGETIVGNTLTVPPFGTAVIDVGAHFGEAGNKLLAATENRGSLTMHHQGHSFGSFFFHVDRATNEILSGRHTQPPALAVCKIIPFNYIATYLGSKLPLAGHIVPVLSFLKHNPKIYRTFYPHHSHPNYPGSIWQYLEQSRWMIYLRMMGRALYFLAKRGFRIEEIAITSDTALNTDVIQHNLWNQLKLFQFSRGRVETLLYPLKSIFAVKPEGKTLCIGPKNEGENLLLEAHGFRDVIGIDLFTYSPKILLMDVHRMTFPDNTFDTIICGWMITYCYDVKQAIKEIVRVAKDGALIVCSFGVSVTKEGPHAALDFIVTRLPNGVSDLLKLFEPYVGHVSWWNEQVVPGTGRSCVVIFQIKKSCNTPTDNTSVMVSYNK